jgi:AraC-like DNA-binding protein
MNSTKSIKICFAPGAVPTITKAGRFNLNDRDFTTVYNIPYASVHLYFYHATVRIGENELEVSPGDITITPPRVKSSYHLPEPGMHFCAHFVLPRAEGNELELPIYQSGKNRSVDVGFLFEEMIEFYRMEDRIAQRASGEALRLLLLHLALRSQAGHGSSSELNGKLETVCRLIEAAPSIEYSASILAKRVNLSPNYLARMFRQQYGMTIKRYQLSVQMERAVFLLQFSNLTIKEIGVMAGMPDPQYFNKRFRCIKGTSPTAFRNRV